MFGIERKRMQKRAVEEVERILRHEDETNSIVMDVAYKVRKDMIEWERDYADGITRLGETDPSDKRVSFLVPHETVIALQKEAVHFAGTRLHKREYPLEEGITYCIISSLSHGFKNEDGLVNLELSTHEMGELNAIARRGESMDLLLDTIDINERFAQANGAYASVYLPARQDS